MTLMSAFRERIPKWTVFFSLSILFSTVNVFAQAGPETPKEKPAAAPQEKPSEPPNAAQIELLETKYRFEENGDSRKEVHALVKINSELGVRQFARLNFDYNRSFQSVEIPLVHITHASGGTADILPSAITDAPNPAVEKFPAYHDVRVKSVRVLGLEPGDLLEYRVVTTTTHHPLAPDFWLEHTFDRSGVVTEEQFEIDVPGGRKCGLDVVPEFQYEVVRLTDKDDPRVIYRWKASGKARASVGVQDKGVSPDVVLTTFDSWLHLSLKLGKLLTPLTDPNAVDAAVATRAREIIGDVVNKEEKLKKIYSFVSRISTVDVPLGISEFHTRGVEEIFVSGYATAEDKLKLFQTLCAVVGIGSMGVLSGAPEGTEKRPATPAAFSHLLISAGYYENATVHTYRLDPGLEVAPFGVVSPAARKPPLLAINPPLNPKAMDVFFLTWLPAPSGQTLAAVQSVNVNSELVADGTLKTAVRYSLRGDNELLLRVTFHKTPPEKQKEIAQYLALSDGFRGKVTSVKTSDPYETEKPFEVEYDITQEKFVDWTKKPVRIPALLPLPGLPEAPKKAAADAKIELGPPLDVELSGTLRLPPGTTAQAPPGTSVKRDYATFASQYSAKLNILHFSRHLNFIAPELPNDRALDLNAFLHAVQNDQALLFELEKPDSPAPAKPK